MTSTGHRREHVLDFIVDHGSATVARLSTELGLPDASVRRYLDQLVEAGLVTDRPVRQATGRPYRLYSATDRGVRDRRDHSDGLAARLVAQIAGERSRLDRITEGLAEQLAADHRADVPADAPLEERVANTVVALRGEGILDEWQRTEDGFVMHNHGCPYRSAADNSDCVCESDRRAIEKLLGVDVTQAGSLAQGDPCCEFIVRTPTEAQSGRKGHGA